MQICLFGDSIGRGVVLCEPTQRYEMLPQCFANLLPWRVENHCKFGSTLPKGAQTVARYAQDLAQFSYVLLEFGGNDSDFDWKAVSTAPLHPHTSLTPPSQFVQRYLSLLEDIRRAGGRPVLLNMVPVDADCYYQWLSRRYDGAALAQFLGTTRSIEHYNELYNHMLWHIATQSHTPLLDVRSGFLAQRDYRAYLCSDGIHPNEKGHRLIADILSDNAALPSLQHDIA